VFLHGYQRAWWEMPAWVFSMHMMCVSGNIPVEGCMSPVTVHWVQTDWLTLNTSPRERTTGHGCTSLDPSLLCVCMDREYKLQSIICLETLQTERRKGACVESESVLVGGNKMLPISCRCRCELCGPLWMKMRCTCWSESDRAVIVCVHEGLSESSTPPPLLLWVSSSSIIKCRRKLSY